MLATWLALATTAWSPSSAVPTYNVLVAGYGAWEQHDDNPSSDTATILNGTCTNFTNGTFARVCFLGWNITVDHDGASMVQRALEGGAIQSLGVDAIITLGLETDAKGLKVELTGANILADTIFHRPIDPKREYGAISPATFDMARLDIAGALGPIVASVAAHKRLHSNATTVETDDDDVLESLWSRDAGTYYCNEALYRSSSTIRRLRVTNPRTPGVLLPFVFVHLPSPKVAPVATVVAPAIAALAKALLVDVRAGERA